MSKRIKIANKATATELAASLAIIDDAESASFSFELHVATELDTSARAALWSIFEENMYDLYVGSSMGWDPDTKRAEMFDPLSRFIIVRHNQEDHLDQSKSKSASIIAYSMFRFEREERQNVLYCYELQVQREFRRAGLGRRLMQQLVSIGKRWYMENIMLTVLKSNTPAREFYNKLGFGVDPTSPEYEKWEDEEEHEEYDYEILSKSL